MSQEKIDIYERALKLLRDTPLPEDESAALAQDILEGKTEFLEVIEETNEPEVRKKS